MSGNTLSFPRFIEYQGNYLDIQATDKICKEKPCLNEIPQLIRALNSPVLLPADTPAFKIFDFDKTSTHLNKLASQYSLLKEKYTTIGNLNCSPENSIKKIVKAYAAVLHPFPSSKYKRLYPYLSSSDRFYFSLTYPQLLGNHLEDFNNYIATQNNCRYRNYLVSYGLHSLGLSFEDSEIEAIEECTLSPSINCKFYKGSNSQNKCVHLQFGINGSYSTCIAMLISDLRGYVSPESIKPHQLNYLDHLTKKYSIKLITLSVRNIQELKELLTNGRSFMVKVNNRKSHYVIIDGITDLGIYLRDPFHGWSIVVTPLTLIEKTGLCQPGVGVSLIEVVQE